MGVNDDQNDDGGQIVDESQSIFGSSVSADHAERTEYALQTEGSGAAKRSLLRLFFGGGNCACSMYVLLQSFPLGTRLWQGGVVGASVLQQ